MKRSLAVTFLSIILIGCTAKADWKGHYDRGVAAYEEGRHLAAQTELDAALKIAEAEKNQSHLLSTYTAIGDLYTNQFLHERAFQMYKRAELIGKPLFEADPKSNIAYLESLERIASFHHDDGNKEGEALRYYTEVVKLDDLTELRSPKARAEAIARLAAAYYEAHKYRESYGLMVLRLVPMYEEVYGKDSLELATHYQNMANMLWRQMKNFAEAEKCLQKCEQIRLKAPQTNEYDYHRRLYEVYDKMQQMYRVSGQADKAEIALHKTLKALEYTGIDNTGHRKAKFLRYLAEIEQKKNKVKEAKQHLKEAEEAQKDDN